MRSSKINYLLVGTFILTMIVAVVVSIAMLTGRTGAVDDYHAVYTNVTGIKFGTQVIYEGYPIGQVESVAPEQREGGMVFRVDFSVAQGWKIPEDSKVEIAAPGLLAAKTLSIHAGASKTALPPGSAVRTLDSPDVFGAMTSLADQLSSLVEKEVKPLLQNVSFAVTDINNFLVGDGSTLVTDASALIKDFGQRVPRIADDIETFTRNLNQASSQVMKLASTKNREQIEDILNQLDEATIKFQKVLGATNQVMVDVSELVVDPKGDVDAIVSESRYIVESLSRHIDSINQNMEGAARNMNEFSRQIRANPGLLLSGSPQADQAQR
jgi:phospholipid/cholesterol/gamma-HCH transport system substrate-binding protein